MLTPYDDALNAALAAVVRNMGVDVLEVATFAVDDDRDIAAVDSSRIETVACEIVERHPECQAIFIACNALRAVETIRRVERRTGKLALTSTQLVIWEAFAAVDPPPRVPVLGRLLDLRPPASKKPMIVGLT